MAISSLQLVSIGPIRDAHVTFGDLTVFIGPQATGKSILLQFLKLVEDKQYIHNQLRKHGIDWERDEYRFLDVYFGGGMQRIWDATRSAVRRDGKPIPLAKLARSALRDEPQPTVFYIPAQRVLALANGWPRPFQAFSSDDPFTIRDFSETFRLLMEQEFNQTKDLFPKTNRLKAEYRELLEEHVFARFKLEVDRHGAQKRLVLRPGITAAGHSSSGSTAAGNAGSAVTASGGDGSPDNGGSGNPDNGGSGNADEAIPFMAWSAGQREFVPLLMGLYWLLPPGSTPRRGDLRWVIIEEPEMGLHPKGISVVLLLVLELLSRGYRVCVSTHSHYVLDIVWAIQIIKKYHADAELTLKLFEVRRTPSMKRVAQEVSKKRFCVYYFDRNGTVRDISDLNPGSPNKEEAGWGGLSEFSGRVNDVVAEVVNTYGKDEKPIGEPQS